MISPSHSKISEIEYSDFEIVDTCKSCSIRITSPSKQPATYPFWCGAIQVILEGTSASIIRPFLMSHSSILFTALSSTTSPNEDLETRNLPFPFEQIAEITSKSSSLGGE